MPPGVLEFQHRVPDLSGFASEKGCVHCRGHSAFVLGHVTLYVTEKLSESKTKHSPWTGWTRTTYMTGRIISFNWAPKPAVQSLTLTRYNATLPPKEPLSEHRSSQMSQYVWISFLHECRKLFCKSTQSETTTTRVKPKLPAYLLVEPYWILKLNLLDFFVKKCQPCNAVTCCRVVAEVHLQFGYSPWVITCHVSESLIPQVHAERYPTVWTVGDKYFMFSEGFTEPTCSSKHPLTRTMGG